MNGGRSSLTELSRTWAPAGLIALLFAVLVQEAARPLSNPDTWFHLRLGKELLETWSLTDPGAASRFATAPWLPTQWSTQEVAAAIEGWAGLPGVAWLFGALSLSLVAVLYMACRREAAPLPAAGACFLGVIASTASLSARPQVVSLVLLAITMWAWLASSRDLRPRWWLVPMTWIWATAHGFWSVGIVVGAVVVVGLAMDRRLDFRAARRLATVPLLSLVAACLTPVGPALLTTQFAVTRRTSLIGEWEATSFHEWRAATAALMVAAVVVVWSRRGSVPWVYLLLLLLGAALAANAVRTVSLGAVIVAPLLAGAWHNSRPSRPVALSRTEVGLLWGAVAVAVGVLAVLTPRTAEEPSNVPAGLAGQLASLPSGTAVMVDNPTGSWVEWRFPELHPTMDGMFDAYTLTYLRDYQEAISLQPGWETFINETGAQAALLLKDGPVAEAMVDRLGWQQSETYERWVFLQAPQA